MKANEKIIYYREQLGWHQKDLVLESGVSQSEVSKIENGTAKNIKPCTWQKLADALKVNVNDLLDDAEVIKKPTKHLAMTDEEAILNKGLEGMGNATTPEEKFEIFKKTILLGSKRVAQRELYMAMLKDSAD